VRYLREQITFGLEPNLWHIFDSKGRAAGSQKAKFR